MTKADDKFAAFGECTGRAQVALRKALNGWLAGEVRRKTEVGMVAFSWIDIAAVVLTEILDEPQDAFAQELYSRLFKSRLKGYQDVQALGRKVDAA